ncbi:MAG: hypothetical protein K1X29_04640 [Bdellovibrionales bacterium]|nr:hypothetical protein [Bdellovibrionales bacterium]
MTPRTLKAFNPDSEVRAFIYQQIQELSEFATGLGAVVIMLEEVEGEKPGFIVNMVVSPEDLGLRVKAEGRNIYEALSLAKAEAKSHLVSLYVAMDISPQPKVDVIYQPPSSLIH